MAYYVTCNMWHSVEVCHGILCDLHDMAWRGSMPWHIKWLVTYGMAWKNAMAYCVFCTPCDAVDYTVWHIVYEICHGMVGVE